MATEEPLRNGDGKSLRDVVPRAAHAEWSPRPDRPDPVGILVVDDDPRVAELAALRNTRMAVSPFAYLRGSAGMMALDLAGTPTVGVRVQACGDAHLSNFGIFATPDHSAVFDLNDFDETLPAPFEWDLKRLAASIEVLLRMHGAGLKARNNMVSGAIEVYRHKVAEFASWRALDVWYARIPVPDLVSVMPKTARQSMLRESEKARRKNHLGRLSRLTAVDGEHRRFLEDPPILVPLREPGDELDEVHEALDSYRLSLSGEHRALFEKFTAVDIARRLVSVGGVGLRSWIGLFEGPEHPARDPLFLQIKEAGPSVLESSLGRSAVGHHGQRIVAGQRMIQMTNDVFLGFGTAPSTGRQFTVRQLWDVRGPAEPHLMDQATLGRFTDLCAWVLARAHSRTGDASSISGYLGKGASFDKALTAFARRYADQNAADYAAVKQAIADGVLPVVA
jgi:uncharacterized protein (DUF2252 family)